MTGNKPSFCKITGEIFFRPPQGGCHKKNRQVTLVTA